ncbi:MAG: hypothetical protein JKY08_01280, partial [Flavobacteriaceae bacterium]|nr:hypothetical protein [Flavobacteriaceae bacterium]
MKHNYFSSSFLSIMNSNFSRSVCVWLFFSLMVSGVQAQCLNGFYDDVQYVTGGGAAGSLYGPPDGEGVINWARLVTVPAVSFNETFTTGATIIITARAYGATAYGMSFLVSFSTDGIVFTTPSLVEHTFVVGDVVNFQQFTYTLTSAENAAYSHLKIIGASSSGVESYVYTEVDAVRVSTSVCYTCSAGAAAPVLSFNSGPSGESFTFDLTTVTSNMGPNGAVLSWHTDTPVSSSNAVVNWSEAPIGVYYAAFYHAATGCYSYYTSIFNVVADFDEDGIPDIVDLDDDNDGILDIIECPAPDLLINGNFDYSDIELPGKLPSHDGLSEFQSHLNGVYFNGGSTPGEYQNWDFTIGTPDWSEAQYLAGSSNADPRTGEDYKINIKESDNGGGFLIFSLANESVKNNITGLTVGKQYILEFEMGTLPNYGYSGTVGYDYDIHYVRFGFLNSPSGTGVNLLFQTPLDATAYTEFYTDPTPIHDFSESPDQTMVYNPHWKKYRIVFEATATAATYEFYLENATVVVVDGFSLIEVPDACIRHQDTDSDGDGCPDAEEAGSVGTGSVGENGLYDMLETFVDSGILAIDIDLIKPYDSTDTSECADPCTYNAVLGTPTINDPDGDGINNVCDLDDDNDGIVDSEENILNTNPDIDADGDGVPLYLDDDDNDASVGDVNMLIENGFDTDNDGLANHLDLDADNDGIYDVIEAGGIDLNSDGKADDLDGVYSDTGGIPDTANFGLDPINTVDETASNFLNIDSDGDSCFDTNEAYNNASTDTNSDGTFAGLITNTEIDVYGLVVGASYVTPSNSYTTVDYKNSVCYVEYCTEDAGIDTDNDGVNDICDLDIDNDGILNSEEACHSLHWGTAPLTWVAGEDVGSITIPGTIEMSIEITTTALGNLDIYGGTNVDLAGTGILGGIDDLAVYFDPDDNQGSSPVQIKIDFSEKMYNLNFKISDIDGGHLGKRRDKITITSDIGNPVLKKVSDSYSSFTITNNTATGIPFISSDNDDVGTVLVIVPNGAKTITILYEEEGEISDPNGRGIGILGDLNYCLDTDNDGVPDANDLDSDGDSCNDVIESGGIDANNDGILDGTGFDTDGLIIEGIGGYVTTEGNERMATRITMGVVPSNQVGSPGDATIFVVNLTSETATSYTSGTPSFDMLGNANSGIKYQWYIGDPDAGGIILTNGGVYTTVETATLNISDVATLGGTEYCVLITHDSNVCIREIRCATLSVLDAVEDDFTTTPLTGGDSTTDITDNDTLDGTAVVIGTEPGEITLSGVTVPSE